MTIKFDKVRLLNTTILVAGLALFSQNAWAQDVTNPDVPTAQNPDSEAPSEEAEELIDLDDESYGDEIVVTGSRIQRSEFTSAAPVQIVTAETASLEGLMSTSEILQGSSVAAGSGQINNTFTGFVVDGGAGVNTLSLRGLGAQRTLVLLNGRRLGPAGVGGTVGPVDFNILPNSAVQRSEILKDGASSIYGSDAVAGVANIITKDNLDGMTAGAFVSVPEAGGAEQGTFWGSYGKSFDLMSFNVSGEYSERKELNIGDRDNLACPQDLIYDQETGERSDAIDAITGTYKCFNSVEGYIQTFFPDDAPFGVGGSFYGSRLPDPQGTSPDGYRFIPFQERSYNDPREQETDAISPNKSYTLFGEAKYAPSSLDNAELYGELLFNRRESKQENFRQIFPYIHQDSAANPLSGTFNNDFCNQFAVPCGVFVAPVDGLQIRPIVLVPSNTSQDVNYLRGVAGMRGKFGDVGFLSGWNYDLTAIHSISDGEYNSTVVPIDRLSAAIGTNTNTNALMDVCGAGAPAGCVPVNLTENRILLNGEFTAAEQAYLFPKETGQTDYTQTILEGVITGDLFSVPAGEVAAAVGVSARWDEIDDVPGEFSIEANSWGRLSAGRTNGDDSVQEVFGEIELPILANKTFAEDLSLNASARYSNYDSVGSATTYKVGLDWALNDMFRLRGTYGTSFRAPALYELYLQDQTSFLGQTSVDPCIRYGVAGEDGNINTPQVVQDNCASQGIPVDYAGTGGSALITRGGGLGRLDPEDSTASSVGFVFTPNDVGLSLSLDYFEIEIENQIGSFAAGVVGACYRDSDFDPDEGFCSLFTRELDTTAPNYLQITDIDASYRNIPTQTTKGFDITGRFEKEFNYGDLEMFGQATITKDDKQSTFSDDVNDFNGTAGDPELVGNLQTRFSRKDWTYTWTMNYTGSTDNLGYEGEDGEVDFFYSGPSYNRTKVDSFTTHDLSVRKEWDTVTVIAGVGNVLDEEPPLISDGDDAGSAGRFGNYPFSSQYFDGYIGRRFFFRVDKTF